VSHGARSKRAGLRAIMVAGIVAGGMSPAPAEAVPAPLLAPRPAPSSEPAPLPAAVTAPAPAVGPPAPPVPSPLPSPELIVTPRLLLQTDAVVLHHGPDAPAIEDGTTRPGFYLRRARAGLDVRSGDWRARFIGEVTARAEVADAALDSIAGELARGRTRATEAFIAYAPHKAFGLAFGALRVPLGLSRQIDEGDLRLPERARIIARTTPDFRMGVAASGDLGLLQYAAGGYSAAPVFGSTFRDGGSLLVGRLAVEPLGPVGLAPDLRRRDDPWYGWWRFSIGVSTFYATVPGANEAGLGGDGQLQWARLCLTGELLWTRRDASDRLGFTIEPGLFLVPDRLEVVGRFESFHDQLGTDSPVDSWGVTLGVTGFATSDRHARLQAAYTIRGAPVGIDRTASWAVVRATFTL
jgi:hypothetical protein